MAKITYDFPDDKDIAYLAANLRPSDIAELEAVCGLSPDQAIIQSLQQSPREFLFSAYADGQLLCIGGAAQDPMLPATGIPWLLATPLMDSYTLRLTKDAKFGIKEMLKRWPILANVVDARNTKSINWLKALGFTLSETTKIIPGLPVYRFEMRI